MEELNNVQEENLISLLASPVDRDIQLAHEMIVKLGITEEYYEKLIRSANKIMAGTIHKQWQVEECKFIYRNLINFKKTDNEYKSEE